jgi:hypothetical protein
MLHVVSARDARVLIFLVRLEWVDVFLMVVAGGFVPDYVALLKTRAILKVGRKYPAVFVLCLDAASSIAISLFFFILLPNIVLYPESSLKSLLNFNWTWELRTLFSVANPVVEFREIIGAESIPLYSPFYLSTLFTSVWLALIVISSTLIKLLAPLHRFTTWLFDVEKHPLEAVGIVTGALVILGAAIGTVVQRL